MWSKLWSRLKSPPGQAHYIFITEYLIGFKDYLSIKAYCQQHDLDINFLGVCHCYSPYMGGEEVAFKLIWNKGLTLSIVRSLVPVSTCARCDRNFGFNHFCFEKRLRHKNAARAWKKVECISTFFSSARSLRQITPIELLHFLLTNSVEALLEEERLQRIQVETGFSEFWELK